MYAQREKDVFCSWGISHVAEGTLYKLPCRFHCAEARDSYDNEGFQELQH